MELSERQEMQGSECVLMRMTKQKEMKRTAVLFISHIVNAETLFRYNHLKQGCDEYGYDLFWALDESKEHDVNL